MYLPTRAPLSDLILTIVRSLAGSIPCTGTVGTASTVPTIRGCRLSELERENRHARYAKTHESTLFLRVALLSSMLHV